MKRVHMTYCYKVNDEDALEEKYKTNEKQKGFSAIRRFTITLQYLGIDATI